MTTAPDRKYPVRCPLCEEPLIRESMSLVPSFQCTKCHASPRISRVYGVVARILAAGLAAGLCLALGVDTNHLSATLFLFALVFFVSYIPVALAVAVSFPPHVHHDEEKFVRLGLGR